MSDSSVKVDAILKLTMAIQWAEWSANMKGDLTYISAWKVVSGATTLPATPGPDLDAWNTSNDQALGTMLMRVDRSFHHLVEDANGN